MRIEAILSTALLLATLSPVVLAQEVEDAGADEQTAPAAVDGDDAAGQAGKARQGGSGAAPPAPARFVPRETISPDSVIAFPADI